MKIELNSENFEEEINKVQGAYYIKFGQPTCGPCNSMKPVLEKFCELRPNNTLFEVDTNDSPELADKFSIRAVPTIFLCEDREVIYTFHGATPLNNLLYAIDNKDDEHLREYGEFKKPDSEKKNDQVYYLILAIIIVLFLVGYYLIATN